MHWIQLNVGLVRPGESALPSARALFDKISPLVERWRSAAELRWFFFMRKPPDVRLRFLVSTNAFARHALSAAMHDLQHANCVREYFYSDYEPESDRFGGPDGMFAVHAHFDADTAAWLRLDGLDQNGQRALSAQGLLPALIQDLFQSAGRDDNALVEASWQRLWFLISTPAGAPLPVVAVKALDELRGAGTTTPEEAGCVRAYAAANKALAKKLSSLAQAGKLDGDLADVLANVAFFTFHRHGFSGERSSPLVAATMDALRIPRPGTR